MTIKQRQENWQQQSRYYHQKTLIETWQRKIGIEDITKLGSKQLRKKIKQQQRLQAKQKKLQAKLLRQQ